MSTAFVGRTQYRKLLELMSILTGLEKDSSQLVIGDLVNLSQSNMPVLAADMFLLTGDAIINESMLTGESVPVSKIPIKDEDLVKWKDSTAVTAEQAKSFLYSGTRVIRVRSPVTVDIGQPQQPALALVARTG